MTVLATLAATLLSVAALAWLAATDPKRRRVFHLAPFEGRRRVWPALAATLLPGPALLALGNSAGFVAWLGAITVAGWGVAALTPAGAQRLRAGAGVAAEGLAMFTARTLDAAARAGRWGAAAGRCCAAAGQMPARIATLEARVAALEAEVQSLKGRREAPRLGGGQRSTTSSGQDAAPQGGAGEPPRQAAALRSPATAP